MEAPVKSPRQQNSWRRILRSRASLFWHKVVTLHDSPHRIALGSAIGVFIGWLPLVGQMVLSMLFAKIFRANVLASIPWAWITNPVTTVPFYFAHYELALMILPEQKHVSREDFQMIFTRVDEKLANLSGWERWTTGMYQGLIESCNFLSDIIWPLMLGTSLIGMPAAIAVYFIIRRAVDTIQKRRRERLSHWSAKAQKPASNPPSSPPPSP